MSDVRYTRIESPIGPLLLAGDDQALIWIGFGAGKHPQRPDPEWREDARPLANAAQQLREYFAGTRRAFQLTLAPAGTEFQRRVWDQLVNIPYGETISYGELARRIGDPRAARAVGLANGSNPIPIVIPCHRVIGSDGRLVGFGGGLDMKERLLAFERGQLALI
jgi:methylated-DNA-[protein]-cysteine S-methyltransferase